MKIFTSGIVFPRIRIGSFVMGLQSASFLRLRYSKYLKIFYFKLYSNEEKFLVNNTLFQNLVFNVCLRLLDPYIVMLH